MPFNGFNNFPPEPPKPSAASKVGAAAGLVSVIIFAALWTALMGLGAVWAIITTVHHLS